MANACLQSRSLLGAEGRRRRVRSRHPRHAAHVRAASNLSASFSRRSGRPRTTPIVGSSPKQSNFTPRRSSIRIGASSSCSRPGGVLAISMVFQGLDRMRPRRRGVRFSTGSRGRDRISVLDRRRGSSPFRPAVSGTPQCSRPFRASSCQTIVRARRRTMFSGPAISMRRARLVRLPVGLAARVAAGGRTSASVFVDALVAAASHRGVALHVNKGLAGASPEAIAAARDTAMNPAVTDAFALAISGGGRAARLSRRSRP